MVEYGDAVSGRACRLSPTMRLQGIKPVNHLEAKLSSEPPSASASTLLAVMRRITATGQYAMSLKDLSVATELPGSTVQRLLYHLQLEGKAFADGRARALRYYLYADAREDDELGDAQGGALAS